MNWKRPLGLLPLLSVLLTLVVLSAMLATMVWGRISLLQNGREIVLKTAPIDPRDLLRGYFVRLSYDIGTINVETLDHPMSETELADGFKSHSRIFIKLQPDRDGFWSPISVHRTRPEKQTGQHEDAQTIFIRGRIRYGSCKRRNRAMHQCKVFIRYGIEKFFAQKARAKKLEDFGRQSTPEIKELSKQIEALQKTYRLAIREHRLQARGENKREMIRAIQEKPETKRLSERLKKLRSEQSELQTQNREEMAKRFAVLVRVDRKSGEAAISGLQLDGKRIYEERLF